MLERTKIPFRSENGQHDLNLGFYIRPLADSLGHHSATSFRELNRMLTENWVQLIHILLLMTKENFKR